MVLDYKEDYKQATHRELRRMYERMEVSRNICLDALLDINVLCENAMYSHGDEGYALNEEAVKKIVDGAIKNA